MGWDCCVPRCWYKPIFSERRTPQYLVKFRWTLPSNETNKAVDDVDDIDHKCYDMYFVISYTVYIYIYIYIYIHIYIVFRYHILRMSIHFLLYMIYDWLAYM